MAMSRSEKRLLAGLILGCTRPDGTPKPVDLEEVGRISGDPKRTRERLNSWSYRAALARDWPWIAQALDAALGPCPEVRDFRGPARTPAPCPYPPGSPERLEEMARRAARGEQLHHPEDATGDGLVAPPLPKGHGPVPCKCRRPPAWGAPGG
jgi:hypothetical protein